MFHGRRRVPNARDQSIRLATRLDPARMSNDNGGLVMAGVALGAALVTSLGFMTHNARMKKRALKLELVAKQSELDK